MRDDVINDVIRPGSLREEQLTYHTGNIAREVVDGWGVSGVT